MFYQFRVHLFTTGFVIFVGLVTEGAPRQVITSGHIVWLQLVYNLHDHSRQAIESAGWLAPRRRELRERVVAAVQNRMRVKKHQLFLATSCIFTRHVYQLISLSPSAIVLKFI